MHGTRTAQKMKFSIKDFFRKCDQTADLVTFTEEILNGKLHFLCSVSRTFDKSGKILIDLQLFCHSLKAHS